MAKLDAILVQSSARKKALKESAAAAQNHHMKQQQQQRKESPKRHIPGNFLIPSLNRAILGHLKKI